MLKFLRFSVYFANLLDFTLTDVKSMSARYKKRCFCFDLFCFWCMEDFCPKNWNISTCNPYIWWKFQHAPKRNRYTIW